MKWGYKTVHFELKKEGLLGGSFLDEAEIEEQLNDFGRSGWELISVIEVQQGIICFFKQPLQITSSSFAPAPVEEEDETGYDDDHEYAQGVDDDQEFIEVEDDLRYREYEKNYEDAGDPYVLDDDYGEEERADLTSYPEADDTDEVAEAEDGRDDGEDNAIRRIGAIRIE